MNTQTSVDKFLKKDISDSIFLPAFLILLINCLVNAPFAFFYTSLFIHYYGIKKTNPQIFHEFVICSFIFYGYFILLGLSLYVIDTMGGVNLHPNSNERPFFYFI